MAADEQHDIVLSGERRQIVIAIGDGTASSRVGAGFLAGEAVATAGLAVAVVFRSRDA